MPKMFDSPQEGVLGKLGYKVGAKGQTYFERRKILATAYALHIPKQWTDIHPEKWGDPKSEKRYQKIVACLNNFSVGKDPDRCREAISEWQSDLEWFQKTYGKGRFGDSL